MTFRLSPPTHGSCARRRGRRTARAPADGADAVTATEASRGHYIAPFAALDAGAWQLVISVDGASAAYALDVTR